MQSYLLAHDLGTSGNKATLYDLQGKLKGSVVHAYPVQHPHTGWVEQDPEDWWNAVCRCTQQLLQQTGVAAADIAAVCFSAQMSGCLLVDKEGRPLRPMITWADTRSQAQAEEMLQKVSMEEGYRITGHRISSSYSSAKLLWVKQNEPEIYKKAGKMLQAKDYIIFKLTGKLVSDYSDSSGTGLLDIGKKKWSQELLQTFGLREDLMPEVHPSTAVAGPVSQAAAAACGLLAGTPVVMGGGDGCCATVGAGAITEGATYNVLGTSSWIAMATSAPRWSSDISTFNYIHLDENLYTPCGTMQASGMSYNWYRDTLCQEEARQAEEQGLSIHTLLEQQADGVAPGAGGLLYLPYLMGERSPRWNTDARGAFIGLDVSTTKAEMTRAIFEGIGYNLKAILTAFEEGGAINQVTVIGGGAKNDVWLQILADIWQKPVHVPRYLEEATSMGAAVCGGVGVGAFSGFSVMQTFNPGCRLVLPNPANRQVYQDMFNAFNTGYTGLVDCYAMLCNIRRKR